MNKKLNFALNILLIVVVCLAIFSGCTQDRVKPWEIEEDLNLVGKLVRVMHGWIGSYGWTVVLFTVFLKVLMLPLDIWQRFSTRKMALKMNMMQPYIAEIDKRYGANSQKGNQEKQKLFKKYGYSMGSSCLPMIVTMVVFFIMFGGLRSYSTYSSVQTFNALSQTYYQSYAERIVDNSNTDLEILVKNTFVDAYKKAGGSLVDGKYNADFNEAECKRVYAGINAVTTKIVELQKANDSQAKDLFALQQSYESHALEQVKNTYNDLEEGWLWIQNIAQPDTWESVMPQFDKGSNQFSSIVDMSGYGGGDDGKTLYNKLRDAVLTTGDRGESGKWNGLMILPILSIALSFLSMFISQAMEKKNRGEVTAQDQQQAKSNKMMMIMMPLMMAYFGFIYTGAFAIYMVCNYLFSIISTIALRAPVEKMVQKSLAKHPVDNGKASYMR